MSGSARADLLARLAAEVAGLGDGFLRVAVDGVDGAGKTVFADELADALRARGRGVVRGGVDSFHRPRAQRYARGRDDPEGFYRDSHDLAALRRELLDPFAAGGTGRHRTRVFDVDADTPVVQEPAAAAPGSVLVVDGIFLHRPELRDAWSLSVWLRVERATSLRRCAERDGTGSPDPAAPANRRYVEGQHLSLREAVPEEHATHVVDNEDLAHPVLVR